MSRKLYFLLSLAFVLTACQKELDFEYHEINPVVVIEGRITNEGAEVLLTLTRSVEDSIRGKGQPNASVVITAPRIEEHLSYDPETGFYQSNIKGIPGTTYHLEVNYDGKHYEGSSTMPYPATIVSNKFQWITVLTERLLVYQVWAQDPNPDDINYFQYRMDRYSTSPRVKEPYRKYRGQVMDDRGNPPGMVFCDIHCFMELMTEEEFDDVEEFWDAILYEGDSITFQLATIDRPVFDYYQSLMTGQSVGANPMSNLSGGCQGYFSAQSITHAKPVIFTYDGIEDFFPTNMASKKPVTKMADVPQTMARYSCK